MVKQKSNKKATPKKIRYGPDQTNPEKMFLNSEIIYEHSDDLLGTINFMSEGKDALEDLKKAMKDPQLPKEFTPESYENLKEKFKNVKDLKKLRFSDFELKVLEKALDNSFEYFAMKAEFDNLRHNLAWANTAFKDKDYSYEENLREAGGRLGFTKGSEKPFTRLPYSNSSKGKKIKYDPHAVTSHYLELIDSGVKRKEAVLKCVEKFSFQSADSCSRFLRKNGLENIPNFRNIR
jgi:hypothetical protein